MQGNLDVSLSSDKSSPRKDFSIHGLLAAVPKVKLFD